VKSSAQQLHLLVLYENWVHSILLSEELLLLLLQLEFEAGVELTVVHVTETCYNT
jgi:hypothetical protein